MKKQDAIRSISFVLLGILLILDSKTAISAGKSGISLCLEVIIPSLFPFLFLSSLITAALWNHQGWLMQKIGSFFGFPAGTEALAISCLLGGYPVGADAIARAYRADSIGKEDAEKLLFHCCYAGPAFLFGVMSTLFSPLECLALWGIHLLSGALLGAFLPEPGKKTAQKGEIPFSPTAAMDTALAAMGKICGWVILFRVLTAFLGKWFLSNFSSPIQSELIGILELTNGCILLSHVANHSLRFFLASSLLAFGGLCVYLQTLSVIAPLDGKVYLKGKILESLLSLLLAGAYLLLGPASIVAPVLVVFFQEYKNKGGNLGAIRV